MTEEESLKQAEADVEKAIVSRDPVIKMHGNLLRKPSKYVPHKGPKQLAKEGKWSMLNDSAICLLPPHILALRPSGSPSTPTERVPPTSTPPNSATP